MNQLSAGCIVGIDRFRSDAEGSGRHFRPVAAAKRLPIQEKVEMKRDRKVSIVLHRSGFEEIGFGWEDPDGGCLEFGFDTLQELLSSENFLTHIQKNLGQDSVPEYVIQHARKRDQPLPLPDDIIPALKRAFPGVPVYDLTKQKKKSD